MFYLKHIRMGEIASRLMADRLVSQSIVAFFLKIVGALFAFMLHVVIGRSLGVQGAGVYFLALSISTVAVLIAKGGMENPITRLVATHAMEADWSSVRSVVAGAAQIGLSLSAVIAVVLFLGAELLSVSIFHAPDLATPLKWMALATVPITLFTVVAKSLQGLKRVASSMILQSITTPLIAMIGVMILAPTFGPSGASAAYLVAGAATCAVALIFWLRVLSKIGWPIAGNFPKSSLLRASYPLLAAMLVQQLFQVAPILLLGHLESTTDIGLFSVAQRTAALISLILIAANVVVAPKFAELYHVKDFVRLDEVARKGAVMMTLVAAPITIVLLSSPTAILSLFGPGFAEGGMMLRIMVVAQFINVASGSVGMLLMMTGHERSFLTANIAALVVCVILSVGLIPTFGGLGAAVAASISLALVNLLRVRFVWRTMGVMTLPIWQRGSIRDK